MDTRRSLAIAGVAGALIASLTGCIGSQSDAETEPTTGGEAPEEASGEVRVLINTGGNATWLEAAIPVFEEQNPGIDIVLDVQEAAAIRDRMTQLYASDDAPDLAMSQWVIPQFGTLVDAGALTDMSSVWENSGLIDNTTEQVQAGWTRDGVQYAVPLTMTWAPVIFTNEALFEQAGIESPSRVPSAAEWDAMIAAFQEAGITPLAVGAAAGQPGATHFVNARLTAHASGDEYAAFTESPIDPDVLRSEPFVAAIEDLATWGADGIIAEGAANAQEAQAVSLFAAGGAAMLSIGVWGDGIIDSQNVGFDSGWMLYPAAEEDPRFLTINSGGLVVPATADNPEGALAFAEFLMSPEAQAMVASASSQIPTRQDVDQQELAAALLPNTNAMLDEMATIGESSPWTDPRINPFLNENLSRVLVGEVSAEALANELADELSR